MDRPSRTKSSSRKDKKPQNDPLPPPEDTTQDNLIDGFAIVRDANSVQDSASRSGPKDDESPSRDAGLPPSTSSSSTMIDGHAIVAASQGGTVAGVYIETVHIHDNGGMPGSRHAKVPQQAIDEYIHFVLETCGRLEPRGIQQSVRCVTLPLDQVYVSLTTEQEQERLADAVPRNAGERRDPELPSSADNTVGLIPPRDVTRQSVSLPQAVCTNTYLLLLGKPGAGKTTITRYLAALFAGSYRNNLARVIDIDGHDYGEIRLPIRIRIVEFADAYRKDRSLALRAFLARGCNHAGVPQKQIAELFEEKLKAGEALILLDGLDEVADTPTRGEVARRIEMFLSDLEPGNRMVITSRIAGYYSVQLDSRFSAFTLQDMSREQIALFLRRWCVAVQRFHTPQADEQDIVQLGNAESAPLLKAIDTIVGVRRLAANPLLLTILALIHRTTARLPEHRIELYRIATATLLRVWRVAQAGADGLEVSVEEEETLLWPLALWMHQTTETGRIPEIDAKHHLRRLYAGTRKTDHDHPDVIRAIEDLLTRLRDHSGLFVPYPPDECGFLHLTFQEYLAGQALTDDYECAIDHLRNCRHLSRWEEPLRLGVSAQTSKNAAKMIRNAIWCPEHQKALYGYSPSPYEDILRRDFLLAARCLSDCSSIEPTLAHDVADELGYICLNRDGKGKYSPLVDRARAALGLLRRSKVGIEAATLLVPVLQDRHVYRQIAAIGALGKAGQGSPEIVGSLLAVLRKNPNPLRKAVAAALAEAAQDSPISLRLLIDATRDRLWQIRYAATLALGTVGHSSDEVLQILIASLTNRHSIVQEAAAVALKTAAQESRAAVRLLIRATHSRHEKARIAAADALGSAGHCREDAVKALIALLSQDTNTVQYWATRSLGKVGQGSNEVVPLLIGRLKADQWNMREAAASGLGNMWQPPEGALQALISELEDSASDIRPVAARALGSATKGHKAALKALLLACDDRYQDVRYWAAEALGNVGQGSEEAVLVLIRMLGDQDANLKSVSARALGNAGYGSDKAVNALLEAIIHENRYVRSGAASSLGAIGKKSERTLPALLRAIEDLDGYVCDAAWASLDRLVQADTDRITETATG